MDVQDATRKLNRDGVTVAAYAALATFGWFIYTFGPTVPLLRAEQQTSRTVASMHNVAFAVGSVIAGLVAVRVLQRVGRDGGIRLGMMLLTAGALGLVVGSLPDGGAIPITLAAAFVAGVGGAFTVNAVTATLTDRHGEDGAAAVSEGNAVAATVGLVAPIAVGAAAALALTWRGATAVIVPLAVTVWLLTRRAGHAEAFAPTPPPANNDDRGDPLPAAYWFTWIALVVCLMVETAFVTWAPDLLGDRTGLAASAAAATIAAFLGGMAAGRFVVGRLSLRASTVALFTGCLVLAAFGWGIMWVARSPVVAVLGLVVGGLGASGHFPLGSVMLINASRGQADRALGMMAVGLGSAAGAGPFVLGAVADRAGIFLAFLVIPTCLLIALVAAVFAARMGTLTPQLARSDE